MKLSTKLDWQAAEERTSAWWEGEIIDRAVIQVTAPRSDRGVSVQDLEALQEGAQIPEGEVTAWFTDPEVVIPRLEQAVDQTFWGGEAFPVVFPVSIRMVAILAAYLGCPYRLHGASHTAWAEPIIEEWGERPRFSFDPHNEWWRISKQLLEAGAQRAQGRYYVGLPDLNGPSEIMSRLRNPQRLAIDLLENGDPVKEALNEVNVAWLRYWQACVGAIHQWSEGYFYWMGIWSDRPSIDLQSDFSCLISPDMFNEFLLPSIEQQTRWVERTIYHLDGPGAVRHLDALLELPELDGIQWVPGAGAPPMRHWIRLLRRVQAKGKRLVLYCEPDEVETLLAELEPEGVLLNTQCDTMAEAQALLGKVAHWSAPLQWMIPSWDEIDEEPPTNELPDRGEFDDR